MSDAPKKAGLSRNLISAIGALIGFVALMNTIILIYIDVRNAHSSPYMGILAWIVAPAILCFGLLVFIVGMIVERRRRRGMQPEEYAQYPKLDFNVAHTRKVVILTFIGAVVFLTVSVLGSYQAFHYTESDEFCGTVCHSVMHPEYTAYRNSPHARVGCVGCHVGSGAGWYVQSKLSGSYQLYSVLFKKYSRPIQSPVENLRPAQGTCEQCHWPEKFFGAQLKEFNHYQYDETSTPHSTRMLIKIGGGSPTSGIASGIHWHMNIANEVTYFATDRQRQEIPWVRIKDRSGKVTEYLKEDAKLTPQQIATAEKRRMDCVDCHNRPTHDYPNPDRVVDHAIFAGKLDRSLPFVKQQAVKALAADYESTDQAVSAIARDFKGYYSKNHPEIFAAKKAQIDGGALALQEAFKVTRFPEMRVDWRTHRNNVGHMYSQGCFRCHDDQHVSKDGRKISKDCELCHSALDASGNTAQFVHPVELGDLRDYNCTDCHTGGPMEQ
jgi:nitrate/TMAO reductase-like tetraheme cytochrome c subunit